MKKNNFLTNEYFSKSRTVHQRRPPPPPPPSEFQDIMCEALQEAECDRPGRTCSVTNIYCGGMALWAVW